VVGQEVPIQLKGIPLLTPFSAFWAIFSTSLLT
jgi:hypothetical protein